MALSFLNQQIEGQDRSQKRLDGKRKKAKEALDALIKSAKDSGQELSLSTLMDTVEQVSGGSNWVRGQMPSEDILRMHAAGLKQNAKKVREDREFELWQNDQKKIDAGRKIIDDGHMNDLSPEEIMVQVGKVIGKEGVDLLGGVKGIAARRIQLQKEQLSKISQLAKEWTDPKVASEYLDAMRASKETRELIMAQVDKNISAKAEEMQRSKDTLVANDPILRKLIETGSKEKIREYMKSLETNERKWTPEEISNIEAMAGHIGMVGRVEYQQKQQTTDLAAATKSAEDSIKLAKNSFITQAVAAFEGDEGRQAIAKVIGNTMFVPSHQTGAIIELIKEADSRNLNQVIIDLQEQLTPIGAAQQIAIKRNLEAKGRLPLFGQDLQVIARNTTADFKQRFEAVMAKLKSLQPGQTNQFMVDSQRIRTAIETKIRVIDKVLQEVNRFSDSYKNSQAGAADLMVLKQQLQRDLLELDATPPPPPVTNALPKKAPPQPQTVRRSTRPNVNARGRPAIQTPPSPPPVRSTRPNVNPRGRPAIRSYE